MITNIPWFSGCAGDACEFIGVQNKVAIVRYSATNGKETPAPAELSPSSIYSNSTGQIILVQPVDKFVKEAVTHIQNLAVLPIDDNDEKTVDRLMARSNAGIETKPLARRV